MRPILTASAPSAARTTPPAESAFPSEATTAAAKPEQKLTEPPSAAERAPWAPAQNPAAIVRAAVASSCHRRTVRIGLPRSRCIALIFVCAQESPESIASRRDRGQFDASQQKRGYAGVS